MRRGALFAVLLACSLVAPRPQARVSSQTDGVALLLLDLQNALQTGGLAEFTRTSAPGLPQADVRTLEGLVEPKVHAVAIRQRGRDGDLVLAEVFIAYGSRGRVANWMIGVSPGQEPGRAYLASVRELSSFDELIRLDLDETAQFAVRDFSFTAVDFVLTMVSGSAFKANAAGGTTGFVLRGRGRVRFNPSDITEQGQLRILAGRPDFTADIDEVFIRVNPYEHDRRVSAGSMQPVPVDAAALRRARDVFDARAGQSYQFSLGDLSDDRWSIQPPSGGMLVDFRTSRFGWLSYASTPEEPEDIALFDRARSRQISSYASPDHRKRFGAFYTDDDEAAFEVAHTTLDLGFDPARSWLSGRADLRLAMRRSVSAIKLRLADPLVVSSVSSPELGPLLALRAAGLNTLIVGLPEATTAGQTLTLEVQYHGRLSSQPLDREALWPEQDSPAPPRAEAPMGFSIEPRFLYSTRTAWYPQSGSRRHATASTRLTVPADYQPIATGRLVSTVVSEAAGNQFGPRVRQVRTVEHQADRPIRYLAFLVTRLAPVGRARASITADPALGDGKGERIVEIDVLAAPSLAGRRRTTPEGVAAIVTFFGRILGDAPYPSLTVAVLEDTLPGGHSPAQFALINQPHPATPFSWASDPVSFPDAPDFFLAHEVAHQWWGQAVGAKNYHELWTSEGFAQYMAWLYVESTADPETARRLMARMRETASNNANEGPIHLGNRIGHLRANSRAFRAVVYNKSAVVLHMLRRLIGDTAFFDGLGRLYRGSRFKRIGTDDVERAFQAGTPVPLDVFFRRWVLGAETPEIRLTWSPKAGTQVVVRIQQTAGVSVFPLDVSIQYVDGSEERATLPVTAAAEDFTLSVRGPIRRVVVVDDLTIVRIL